MQSDNMLGHYMARRAMYNVLGTLGMNRVILRHKFGVPRENGVFNYQYMVCEEDRHRANLIGELVQVRDGQLHLHNYVAMRSVHIDGIFSRLPDPGYYIKKKRQNEPSRWYVW